MKQATAGAKRGPSRHAGLVGVCLWDTQGPYKYHGFLGPAYLQTFPTGQEQQSMFWFLVNIFLSFSVLCATSNHTVKPIDIVEQFLYRLTHVGESYLIFVNNIVANNFSCCPTFVDFCGYCCRILSKLTLG